MKNFSVSKQPLFQDILHEDGSKSYDVVGRGYIHIKRPSVVAFIEEVLQQGHMGYSYMKVVDKAFADGKITREELADIVRILD